MNFFKSVFSDDPQSSDPPADEIPNSNSTWSFGGLIKTLADKSESVMESYRKDFEELGSGLKKETAVIRGAASRAVNESLEIGASVAQEKLESVGQAIDDIGTSVWKSTAQIISQGRETLLSDRDESDSSSSFDYRERSNKQFGTSSGDNQKSYNRFDMQLRAVQCDAGTYCSEPDDLGEYEKWRLGFDLEEKRGEIEILFTENRVIGDIYREIVPERVDGDNFWSRYFYRVHKLKQAEEARAKLVKRALAGEEEEDLSWDFDEDDDESNGSPSKSNLSRNVDARKSSSSEDVEKSIDNGEGKVGLEGKADTSEYSCKDSDVSVVSSQPSMPEEEDLGWDRIEDIGSNDENKEEAIGSTSRADLRKRLSVAEEDEDLSWDIDDVDDDHLVKA
ncbi:hypothetical protein SLE2022_167150 [Rubroshorea leprosula]